MFKSYQRKDFTKVVNSLESLPFHDLSDCIPDDYGSRVEDFYKAHALASKPWFYPQAIARVAKWTLSRSGDKFDGKALVVNNVKTDWDKGLYWVLMCDKRALAKQYQSTQYCSLTPLIMSAFKTMQGINYKDWTNVHYIINPNLLDACNSIIPVYTTEELLEFRSNGLMTQTGKDAGVVKNAVTTYGIYGLTKELEDGRCGLGSLPQLTRMMLLQTWCAHPSIRSKYSILDPNDWDNLPEPLVVEDALEPPTKSRLNIQMPW